jgi:hypothetical protein
MVENQRVKSSILLSVQYKFPWKFCLNLYVGFAALHRKYSLLNAVVAHSLHSLVRRDLLPQFVYIYSGTYFGVEFYDLISSLAFHCSSRVISVAETLYKMHIGVFLICVQGISNNISANRTQSNQLRIATV